ncbi:18897_t:CDS:2, partial [Gigaspora rosea]
IQPNNVEIQSNNIENEIYEELTYFNNEDNDIIEDDIENDYIEIDSDIQVNDDIVVDDSVDNIER